MRPHARRDILDSVLEIVRKAHAQGSVSTDTLIYESIATLVSKSAKITTSEVENGAEGNEAGFLKEVVLAFFSHDSFRSEVSRPENLRKAKVRLGAALVESNLCNAQTRGLLASIFETWTQSERSRPLREEIEKMRDNNARHL